MKKKYFRRDKKFGKKFILECDIDIDKKEAISFSLTSRETKLYHNWIVGLHDSIEIDDTEDSHVIYPKIQFSPFELGLMITAIVNKEEIILRMAEEDDMIEDA